MTAGPGFRLQALGRALAGGEAGTAAEAALGEGVIVEGRLSRLELEKNVRSQAF